MQARVTRRVAPPLCLAWLAAAGQGGWGCGYQIMRARAPFGCQALTVLAFTEASPSGLSQPLAQALIRRLAADGAAIITDPAAADAVLTGRIEVRDTPTTTMRAVQIYTVVLRVHAELRHRTGQVLWQHDVELGESFLPTDSKLRLQPLVTEARRRTAMARAAEQAAVQLQRALACAEAP